MEVCDNLNPGANNVIANKKGMNLFNGDIGIELHDQEHEHEEEQKMETDHKSNFSSNEHASVRFIYYLDLSLLCLLRQIRYRSIYPSLSLEGSESDKLNNIVLRYKHGSIHIIIDNVPILTTSSITYSRLFSKRGKKGNFLINKYFNIFVTNFVSKLYNNIEYFILYTSAKLEFKDKKTLKRGRAKDFYPFEFTKISINDLNILKDLLYTTDKIDSGFYKFSLNESNRFELMKRLYISVSVLRNKETHSQEFEKIVKEAFLHKFILAVNQPNKNHLHRIVKSEISRNRMDYLEMQDIVIRELAAKEEEQRIGDCTFEKAYILTFLVSLLHFIFKQKHIIYIYFNIDSDVFAVEYKGKVTCIKIYNTKNRSIGYGNLFPYNWQNRKDISMNNWFNIFVENCKNDNLNHFIIYTNNDLSLTKSKELKKSNSKDFYPFIFSKVDVQEEKYEILRSSFLNLSYLYKFSDDKKSRDEVLKRLEFSSPMKLEEGIISQDFEKELKESFLNKFIFAVNQPDREKLKELVKSEINEDKDIKNCNKLELSNLSVDEQKRLLDHIEFVANEIDLLKFLSLSVFSHKNVFSINFERRKNDIYGGIAIDYKSRLTYITIQNANYKIGYNELFPSEKQKTFEPFSINEHFNRFVEIHDRDIDFFIIYTNAGLDVTEDNTFTNVESDDFYPFKLDSIDISRKQYKILRYCSFKNENSLFQFSQDGKRRKKLLKRIQFSSATTAFEFSQFEKKLRESFLDKLILAVNQHSREESIKEVKSFEMGLRQNQLNDLSLHTETNTDTDCSSEISYVLHLFKFLSHTMSLHKNLGSINLEKRQDDIFGGISIDCSGKFIYIKTHTSSTNIGFNQLFPTDSGISALFSINQMFSLYVRLLLKKDIQFFVIYTNVDLDLTKENCLKKVEYKGFYPLKFNNIDVTQGKYEIFRYCSFIDKNNIYQLSEEINTRQNFLKRLEYPHDIQATLSSKTESDDELKVAFIDKLIFVVNQCNGEYPKQIGNVDKLLHEIQHKSSFISDKPKTPEYCSSAFDYELNLLKSISHSMHLHTNIYSINFERNKDENTGGDGITINYKGRISYIKACFTKNNISYSQLFPFEQEEKKELFSINKYFHHFIETLDKEIRFYIIYTNVGIDLTKENELRTEQSPIQIKFDSIDVDDKKKFKMFKHCLFLGKNSLYQFSQNSTTRENLFGLLRLPPYMQREKEENRLSDENENEFKDKFLNKLIFVVNQDDELNNQPTYNYEELYEIVLHCLESNSFEPITKTLMLQILKDIRSNKKS